jgi:hypothetical protein
MAGAVSALFLLDIKGRVLVWRDFRGDVTAVQAERFFTKLLDKEVATYPPRNPERLYCSAIRILAAASH